MSEDVISNMRERVRKLRRLSGYVNDAKATEAINKMIAEMEADIERLGTQRRAS